MKEMHFKYVSEKCSLNKVLSASFHTKALLNYSCNSAQNPTGAQDIGHHLPQQQPNQPSCRSFPLTLTETMRL